MHPRWRRCFSFKYGWIFSVVAPCPQGASRLSVLAATFTTSCSAVTTVVIGAGFAGLAAATALAEAGATVSVFEGRPGLGGRATAFRDPATGERIDNGQHVLAGCYSETLRFLRRIGTQNRLHRPASLRVPMIDEHGDASVLALPPLPSPLHLLAGILAWQGLPLAERISVLRVAAALRRGPQPDAPPQTVRQWLNAHRQSARLSHMFWEPLALATLNQTVEVADVATFLAVLQRMFGPDPEAASLLLPAVPLDDLYARPAADYLRQAGSEVTTNAFCHVTHDGGRVTGVQVRDRHVPADTVIAAVPWFAFPDLFVSPPPALDSLIVNAAALASSPIVTVNLWFAQGALPETLLGLPGRHFQWAFDRRAIAGPTQSSISLVSSGAEAICALPNPALIERARAELAGALPEFGMTPLRHASVVRERRATFSLAPGGPPRPATRTPLAGLVLAGDWIATGLPATIEGAVASGHAAARAVLGHA
jgi:squalene-associated FAD-dependent desaturase